MARLVPRIPWLVVAVGVAVASEVAVAQPTVATSTIPPNIKVSGTAGGATDPLTASTFVINDPAGAPMAGIAVTIDFSACPDIFLCTAQGASPTGPMVLGCAANTITGVTNAVGVVTFQIVGGSYNVGTTPPGHIAPCATVIVDPGGFAVPFPALRVGAFDENGAMGVGGADIFAWGRDFISGINFGRSDFDGSGGVGGGDLFLWGQDFFSGGAVTSCLGSATPPPNALYCP